MGTLLQDRLKNCSRISSESAVAMADKNNDTTITTEEDNDKTIEGFAEKFIGMEKLIFLLLLGIVVTLLMFQLVK